MRRACSLLALLVLLPMLGQGCGRLRGLVSPNLPPRTLLFVEGPLDTVNHVARLHWFGTDEDGYVTGFEVRLLNPADPGDSAWRHTTRTDSVFTVFSPAGYSRPVLQVRAIDDDGDRDPSPAEQAFQFDNRPPTVTLTTRPNAGDKSDTTFASVSVAWNVQDADGDAGKMVYRVWLDGRQDDPEITMARTFTMPSERFKVGGQYTSGYRTLFVQGIDDGGMASAIDSVRWYVRQPVTGARARLLIIDDVPRINPSNYVFDTLYANTAARNLAPGTWSVLQFDFNQPFKSAADLEQTFKLFEAVVWYRGPEVSLSTVLQDHEAGIGAYLSAGGRFYLSGLYLFSGLNANGGLSEGFARQYLNCDGFRRCFVTVSAFTDSTIGWGNVNNSIFHSAMFADTSRQQLLQVRTGEAGGLRVFKVRSTSEIALSASPGAVTPASPEQLPVGVSVAQPGGGRAVILCVPLETSIPRNASTSARFLAKIFAQLGLTGP